jgi:hypothetical protein
LLLSLSIVVAVDISIVIVSCLRRGGAAMAAQQWAQQWQRRGWRSNGDGGAATAVGAQRWQWRCSDGLGGAAMVMVAQLRLRQCSNGLGGTAIAMAMAAQQ